MDKSQKLLLIVTSVLTCIVPLNAVTVNPSLCPTNKIAPHRRAVSWKEESQPRTLGLLYDLLRPSRPRPPYPYINDLNDLQEQPQEDDPDDCGDIEDYDETDLSSITPGSHNYIYNKRGHRELFDRTDDIPSRYSDQNRHRPLHRPPRPQRPPVPPFFNKPSFNPGSQYGSITYRPPPPQNIQSSHIKPVHENTYDDPQETYSPGLVGGILGQVMGFPTKKPTFPRDKVMPQRETNRPFRFPDSESNKMRRARAKPQSVASGIIGSFVDLLLN